MNILDDVKHVSETVIDKLSAQFKDLPRPLLAAIGAGDLAVERLVKLRQDIAEKFGDTFDDGLPSGEEVKDFASDLPGKAQKIASDVAHHLQDFAGQVPDKAQQLIADLPAKAQEVANSLSPDKLKSTVESYTQMVAMVFDNLADRGGETVAKVRSDDEPKTARKAASEKSASKPAAKPATKPAAEPAAKTASKPAAEPAAKTASKPAAKTASKPAAAKTAAKTGATKPAATEPTAKTASKPAAKPAARTANKKPANKPAVTPAAADKPAATGAESDTTAQ